MQHIEGSWKFNSSSVEELKYALKEEAFGYIHFGAIPKEVLFEDWMDKVGYEFAEQILEVSEEQRQVKAMKEEIQNKPVEEVLRVWERENVCSEWGNSLRMRICAFMCVDWCEIL